MKENNNLLSIQYYKFLKLDAKRWWLLFHAWPFDPLKFYLYPWHSIYYSFVKKFKKEAKNKIKSIFVILLVYRYFSFLFFSFSSPSFFKKRSFQKCHFGSFKIRSVTLRLYTVANYCYRKINSCIIGRARFVPHRFPRLSQRELGQGDCRYFAWYVSSHPSTTILSKIDAEILLLYSERRHRCSAALRWNVIFQLLDFFYSRSPKSCKFALLFIIY